MNSKSVKTYTATIYVGSRIGYSESILPYYQAMQWLQEYCNKVGLCVSIVATDFIYTNGNEPGIAIGLINYPRFESTPEKIQAQAIEIAEKMLSLMEQNRVTIVFPDTTITIGSVKD